MKKAKLQLRPVFDSSLWKQETPRRITFEKLQQRLDTVEKAGIAVAANLDPVIADHQSISLCVDFGLGLGHNRTRCYSEPDRCGARGTPQREGMKLSHIVNERPDCDMVGAGF